MISEIVAGFICNRNYFSQKNLLVFTALLIVLNFHLNEYSAYGSECIWAVPPSALIEFSTSYPQGEPVIFR